MFYFYIISIHDTRIAAFSLYLTSLRDQILDSICGSNTSGKPKKAEIHHVIDDVQLATIQSAMEYIPLLNNHVKEL